MKINGWLFILSILLLLLIGCGIEEETTSDFNKTINKTIVIKNNISEKISKENISNVSANINANKTLNLTSNETNKTMDKVTGNLTVKFLNFLNGNSILIITPAKKYVIIDGGTNGDGLYLTKYLRNFTWKVDRVISTNSKDSNIGGLDWIATDFNETYVYSSGINDGSNNYKNFESAAKYLTFGLTKVTKDTEIKLDNDVNIEIMVPFNNTPFEKIEENSLVIKINYINSSFLLMGDCSGRCIAAMSEKDVKADVLAAYYELPIDFVNLVNPKIIVFDKISNASVYNNIKTYTKDNKTTTIKSDGYKYYITKGD